MDLVMYSPVRAMRVVIPMLSAVFLLATMDTSAQLRLPRATDAEGYTLAANATDPAPAPPQRSDAEPQTPGKPPENLRLRNAALIAGSVLLVGAYGMNQWWEEGFTGKFRTESEGWFGQDTKYGGADKLGHAFFSYAGARLLTQGFEALGNEGGQAQRLGFWSALGIMTAVEVLDGYSKQYSFSREDAIMNVLGAGLGYLMERSPEFDRLVDFRLLYKPSEGKGYEPGGDYSGQTYLMVAKASGVPALRENSVLRYFELAAGYGTRGYEDPPGVPRQRNLYFGISINLSEVLGQTVFRGAKERSRTQRATDLFFEFMQVPGTVALARHQL